MENFAKHKGWCGQRRHEAGLYGANEETERVILCERSLERNFLCSWEQKRKEVGSSIKEVGSRIKEVGSGINEEA